MSKWIEYWIKACEERNDHVCPTCGKATAHHRVVLVSGKRGYVEFWCDSCESKESFTFAKSDKPYPASA